MPAIVGALIVINDRTETGSKLAQRIELSPLSPIGTAWDHQFHRLRFGGTSWILVTLKDNSLVAGKYVYPSMASTHEGDRDLYVDSVYVIDQNGGWQPAPQNPSILIRGDQIKTVEFFDNG